jgi:hypothetical protein
MLRTSSKLMEGGTSTPDVCQRADLTGLRTAGQSGKDDRGGRDRQAVAFDTALTLTSIALSLKRKRIFIVSSPRETHGEPAAVRKLITARRPVWIWV